MAEVRTSSVDKHTRDGELSVQLCNYTDVYRNDKVRPSPDLMRATATSDEIARFRLEIGDSVLTKDSEDPNDIGISAHVADTASDFVCGYHLAIARPSPGTHPRYLTWALRSRPVLDHFSNHASGISRYGLTTAGLRAAPVPWHDDLEQRRIADFLDDRVARIDQIIAARRRQQTFAKEELQAALETEFWAGGDRMPLKHLLSSVTSGPRGWGDLVRDEGTPFVRIGNLRPLGIELLPVNLAKVEMPTDAEAQRASLMSGDVLLSITAAFGEVAVWRGGCGTFSQHVARLRPLSTADSDWVGWALQTHSVHDQYSMLAYGGTKIGMGLDQVRNLHVPRLQPRDRAKVAARMADAWQAFSAGQSAFERSVRLFLEYKQSLLTAAVTGEIDVMTTGSGIPG